MSLVMVKNASMLKNGPMLKWLWITLVVVIVDLATKAVISNNFVLYESVSVLSGFFNLTLAHNYGAAFSFLADQPGWQRWFFTITSIVISLVLLYWLKTLKAEEKMLAIGLVLVLGGAIGNLWDRITLGYVVDFLDVYYQQWHWPAFNVADSAICIGAVLLILDSFLAKEKDK